MTTTSTMTGGEALVRALRAHGVDLVFGIPGTHNLEIYKHLAAQGIQHVGTRHEQGAGYAADGYARTSGRVGVAVVTTGPALMNITAAVGQAWSDSVPILVISPGVPLRHPAGGNGLLHEMRDQGVVMRGLAAASLRCTSVADIPRTVSQAFAIMTNGRPRPVHLEVPLDVLGENDVVDDIPVAPSAPQSVDPGAADAMADRLRSATRPVILAGGGAHVAADAVRTLAERLHAPVVTTTNGKGVLPEDHPLALGAGIHLPAVRALVEESDAVLAVGTELAPADLWYGPLPLSGKLLRIDVDPVAATVNATPEVSLVADSRVAVDALLDRLPGSRAASTTLTDQDVAQWRARKQRDACEEGAEYVQLIRSLASALPPDTIVATDNAMACYFGAIPQLPSYLPSSFLFPTGYGTLGYSLPAAIGAALAHPDRPALAMLGDGGIMFTVAELATAAQERIPLPVLVIDNHGYGEIRNEMADRGDPLTAVTFDPPDFATLAEAMHCHGVRLDDVAGLPDAVRSALSADRPTVIHLRLAPSTREADQ